MDPDNLILYFSLIVSVLVIIWIVFVVMAYNEFND